MSVVMSDQPYASGGNVNYFIFTAPETFAPGGTTFTANTYPVSEAPAEQEAGLEDQVDKEIDMADETKVETSQPVALRVGDREFTAEDVQKILGDYQQAAAKQAKLERDLQESRVTELCDKASARGVAPVVVQTARQILLACDMVAESTITLNLHEDGQDKEEKFNLFNSVAKLLGLVPGRIGETPELTYTRQTERPDNTPQAKGEADVIYTQGKEDMTPEEAESLAKERRVKLGIARESGDEAPEL
jgi:hypothetical protein